LKNPNKPPLPNNRTGDYEFKSVVYVYHDVDKVWAKGVVVPGYRSGDGCVSYVLDNYPDSAKGWGCGVSVPCVLHQWEYEYFKKHLDEFKAWLDACDRDYNGKKLPLKDYYEAMKNG
jgi:hypothetical protein